MKLDPLILEESAQLFWLKGFQGINLHDDRRAIGDEECAWLENFAPLGESNARTMYDVAPTLYTTSGTIVYQFSFNIGTSFYEALFFADGSAVQVAIATGIVTTIATAGTFAVTPTLPHCAQWGASGIVIVTSANYYAWDGVLYSPGGAAPAWLSGLAAPLTFTGNTHTTTTVDTLVPNTTGVVIGMMITGTDIPAATFVSGFTATTITLSQAATGTHAGNFTVQWAMPTGIKGTAVEIFTNRVWVFNGTQFTVSAPANGADFSTADGGLVTKSSDGFLRTAFVNARQSNGFLYIFGDGSVNVISNVQTTGSPSTTTFNNQNVDPQNGIGWRDTLVSFGRSLIFANPNGVYAMFGGSADKISDKIDALFEHLNTSTITPSACIVTLFGQQCYCLLMNTLDPTTGTFPGTQRTIMVLWNGEKWFIGSQSKVPLMLVTLDGTGAQVHQAWGNDGKNVFQLFALSSSTLTKKVVSKLYQGRSSLIEKTSKDVFGESSDIAGSGVILVGTIDSDTNASVQFSMTANIFWVNSSGGLITFVNNSGQGIQFISSPSGVQGTSTNQAGTRLGMTLTSTSPDFKLIGMGQSYHENSILGR